MIGLGLIRRFLHGMYSTRPACRRSGTPKDLGFTGTAFDGASRSSTSQGGASCLGAAVALSPQVTDFGFIANFIYGILHCSFCWL